jgi:hypothetical protein
MHVLFTHAKPALKRDEREDYVAAVPDNHEAHQQRRNAVPKRLRPRHRSLVPMPTARPN